MKTTLSPLFVILLALLSTSVSAQSLYYPESFLQKIKAKTTNQALKEEILTVLKSNHQRSNNGGRDTLGCQNPGSQNCYSHVVLGYDGARKILFGKLHLENNGGKYFIRDVYCHKQFDGGDVRPGAIPNGNNINCEHTWPQSKFTPKYPKETQKSDLHHLYPTDSKANSVRGNYNFANITHENRNLDESCTASKSGSTNDSSDDNLFEPPTEHKGNVARALFYFSVRYEIAIPASEEVVLRQWNDLDPVDDAEMNRNDEIQKVQGDRNPFIDFPELVNLINKF